MAINVHDLLVPVFSSVLAQAMGMFIDNLPAILGVFTFFLAVRFGPALLSWFRHRNDPKSMTSL